MLPSLQKVLALYNLGNLFYFFYTDIWKVYTFHKKCRLWKGKVLTFQKSPVFFGKVQTFLISYDLNHGDNLVEVYEYLSDVAPSFNDYAHKVVQCAMCHRYFFLERDDLKYF